MAQALHIQVIDEKKVIAEGTFDQAKVIMGRMLSVDLKIPDARVSRIHAMIERLDDGTIRLTDLASSHGTFVNGERVMERLVSPADDVKLAALEIKIKFVNVEDKVAPALSRTMTPATSARAPLPSSPAVVSTPRPEIQMQGGNAIAVSKDPTVIRSLKETAKERGVLAGSGLNEDLEVTMYWEDTILAIDHYKGRGETVKIGEAVDNTYVIPSQDIGSRFEFVKVLGNSAELRLHPTMKGSVRLQGKMESLEDLRRSGKSQVIISGSDLAKVQIGRVNFFLMFVAEPPAIPRGSVFDQGGTFWSIQFSVAALAALFITLGLAFKAPIDGVVKEIPEARKIIIEQFIKKIQEEKKPPVVEARKIVGEKAQQGIAAPQAPKVAVNAKQGGNEGEGARERGAEGKRGRPDAKNETGLTNRPKTGPSHKVHDAPIRASNDGIASMLKASGLGTKLAKVTGVAGGATGNDPLAQNLGGVGGDAIRNGRGSNGSGLQGTGTGGGGTAVGVGGLGSKGFGGGASGTGAGSIPGKGDFAVGTEAGSVTVVGGLSREEIARVVTAHQNEVRFCYEKELRRDPNFYGKIVFKWTIEAPGSVSTVASSENNTGSVSLETCIGKAVRGWVFPKSPGGSTEAIWPFILKPKGA